LLAKGELPGGQERVGESWEISTVEEHVSVVANGPLAGKTLRELIAAHAGNLVGDAVHERYGVEFPLLVKYIDAREDLSVQVHPGDEAARERHHARGKTEAWFVAGADAGASLLLGFNRATSREEFLGYLGEGRLRELTRVEEARKGDCFFVPAGLLHAIGAGCFIVEIQQASDVTYRVYDYERKDASGNARELHVELAAGVIDYGYHPSRRVEYVAAENRPVRLVACPYFTVCLLSMNATVTRDYSPVDSFVVYTCLEGTFAIDAGAGEPVRVARGETVLVPAALKRLTLRPSCPTRVLEIFIEKG
jgi:mannose-6-phosphate isomerase